MVNTICDRISDSDFMEMKIRRNFKCDRYTIPSHRLRTLLDIQGKRLMLIRISKYRHNLTACESCVHYLGEYPTWDEVKRR